MAKTVERVKFNTPKILKVLNVAAYAHVSSGKDAMLHSLEAQVRYYSDYIQSRHDWHFCGVYADEAITGTKSNRDNFQLLLQKCREGEIDLILCKSISRFARNTVTLLETIRELKNLGIGVIFEEQNINSLSSDGELPQYYVEESHEPIIEPQIFKSVQELFNKRSELFTPPKSTVAVYPFTGKIKCGCCNKNYRRKTTVTGIVWICSTYNTKGKKYCPKSKQIPEEKLYDACCEVLELSEFNESIFQSKIQQIVIPASNRIKFIFTDGTRKTVEWKDRSRSESWTEDMRKTAGERSKKWHEQSP